jgi:hypothetical protein
VPGAPRDPHQVGKHRCITLRLPRPTLEEAWGCEKPRLPHISPGWAGPAGSQIEATPAAVEPLRGKDGLSLVVAKDQTEQLTHCDTPSNVDSGTPRVSLSTSRPGTPVLVALDRLLSELDEQELKGRYYERLSDWSEPGAVKIVRNSAALLLSGNDLARALVLRVEEQAWDNHRIRAEEDELVGRFAAVTLLAVGCPAVGAG